MEVREKVNLTKGEKFIINEALKVLMDQVERVNYIFATEKIEVSSIQKLLTKFQRELPRELKIKKE
jgi:hypothetical protein